MAWYYYTGKVVQAVQIKRGLSKAVKPHTKVEIIDMTTDVQALIRQGLLRQTGKPKGAVSAESIVIPDVKLADVMPKSDMARFVAEKGVTSAPMVSPVSSKVELTEGELFNIESKNEENDVASDVGASSDNGDEEVEEMSTDDGSGQMKYGRRKKRR